MLLGLQDWQWYGIINKGGFRPNKIAGLQLWLDANDASTLFQDAAKTTPAGDGDVVGAWADKSGQGNDATQTVTADKPTIAGAEINGLNTIQGDGVDDDLDISVALTTETVFIVAKHDDTTRLDQIIAQNTNFRIAYLGAGDNIRYTADGTPATVSVGFVETNPHIIRAKWNSTTTSLAINNGTPATGVVAVAAHTYSRIFSRGSAFLLGHIAEVLIYNTALSTPNITLVENYLSAKWGITIA